MSADTELPSLVDVVSSARVVSVPLNTRFRGVDHREAVLIEGPQGWCEFNPFLEYDDAESAAWLAASLEFGWAPLPALVRTSVRVNATIPDIAPHQIAAILERNPGCRTAKVKVAEQGQHLDHDIARVSKVRELLGPEGRIRIDANGAWSLDHAERAIIALTEYGLEYVEQPCATLDDIAALKDRLHDRFATAAPLIAVDESIRKAADPFVVARTRAADVLVLKAGPLGGVNRILAIAEQTHLPVVISSALDTSAGISMGLYAAAVLPQLDFDCGLATAALLAGDVTNEPLLPQAGSIPVQRVQVSPELLTRFAAGEERTQWWLERLERCYRILERQRS